MPAKMERCVKHLMDQGKSEESAWAICNASIDEVDKLIAEGVDECEAWRRVIHPISNDSVQILSNKIDPMTGFLHAKVSICRSGIQEYLGRELGLTGDEALKIFNVLRHPDDVTDENSLSTYRNLVVTDDHPSEMWINVNNIKKYQNGQLSNTEIDNSQDEVFIYGDMTITDADLIEKALDGKIEVSLGYARDLVQEDGTYNGMQYQYKFTNIIANHLSVVDRGRCGGSCRIVNDKKNVIILDENQNNEGVIVKVMINGIEFDLPEEVVNAILAEREASEPEEEEMVGDEGEETDPEKMKELEATNDKLTAQIDTLKAKLKATNDSMSEAKLNKMVAERAELVAFAGTILTADVMPSATEPMAIKKAVVEKHFGISVDGKSDAYIQARFEMVQEDQMAHDASVKKLAVDMQTHKKQQVSNDKIVEDARKAYLERKGMK